MGQRILQIGVAGIWRYPYGLNQERSLIPSSMRIDYVDVPTSKFFGSALPLALETSFRDFGGYDIVHNLSSYPFYPRGRKRFTLVTTAHEMQPVLYPGLTKLRLRTFSDILWEELISKPGIRCLLSSDYIMATSTLTMKGAIKAGFDKRKIFLTPLGLDKRFFSAIKSHAKKKFRIGTIATSAPQKNTFFSIDAVKNMRDSEIEFEIWGKSTYSGEEFTQRIAGDDRIRVMGHAPDNRIVDIYDSFDVFLFPSLFEGFGIPIIEAKARGLPVILFKHGHVASEVKEYCFEAKNPEHMTEIIEKIKANGYNSKLREKAIASARKFTWARSMRETIRAYSAMV
ncbi:MAG: glycosyltransferase [Candidatus Micrarchaeota archaeon]|nr:glycosyltransferase [Candidatus Micrarchaeota archaeon]